MRERLRRFSGLVFRGRCSRKLDSFDQSGVNALRAKLCVNLCSGSSVLAGARERMLGEAVIIDIAFGCEPRNDLADCILDLLGALSRPFASSEEPLPERLGQAMLGSLPSCEITHRLSLKPGRIQRPDITSPPPRSLGIA